MLNAYFQKDMLKDFYHLSKTFTTFGAKKLSLFKDFYHCCSKTFTTLNLKKRDSFPLLTT